MHRHKAIKQEDRVYTAPVSRNENPSAHGGVCQRETCSCGARRNINKNGGHWEVGPWGIQDTLRLADAPVQG